MKKYSFYHIPFMAFYSKALYRDIALNWKGVCFGYLILLLALCWIPYMIKFHTIISFMADNYAPQFVAQIPEITITNGKASIDLPEPYRIIDPKTHRPIIIFDTTGQYTSIEDTGAAALITEKEVMIRKSDRETTKYSFRDIDNFKLERQMIADLIDLVRRYLALALYPFALLGSFMFRIIQTLLYAAIGLLFASLCKSTRTYDSLVRLAVVAITPGLIVSTILEVSGIRLPYAGLWYFLAAMGFLYFGVRAAAQEEKPEPEKIVMPTP